MTFLGLNGEILNCNGKFLVRFEQWWYKIQFLLALGNLELRTYQPARAKIEAVYIAAFI